jgi:hypothetical protein
LISVSCTSIKYKIHENVLKNIRFEEKNALFKEERALYKSKYVFKAYMNEKKVYTHFLISVSEDLKKNIKKTNLLNETSVFNLYKKLHNNLYSIKKQFSSFDNCYKKYYYNDVFIKKSLFELKKAQCLASLNKKESVPLHKFEKQVDLFYNKELYLKEACLREKTKLTYHIQLYEGTRKAIFAATNGSYGNELIETFFYQVQD